jgi:hypothetical protein
LLACFVGVVSLIRPVRWLGVSNRKRAAALLALGVLIAVASFALPPTEVRIEAARTHLDEFIPVYQFNEAHALQVKAPCDRAYQAIQAVTADEIFLFRTLTWLRRAGRDGPESILNAPEKLPILEVATRTGFVKLAEEGGREIVLGTVLLAPPEFSGHQMPTPEEFKGLQGPGFLVAGMNFRVEDAGTGACNVTTETRVFGTDAVSRRKFVRYWRIIYPGSSLLRYTWLRAIRGRAESSKN